MKAEDLFFNITSKFYQKKNHIYYNRNGDEKCWRPCRDDMGNTSGMFKFSQKLLQKLVVNESTLLLVLLQSKLTNSAFKVRQSINNSPFLLKID